MDPLSALLDRQHALETRFRWFLDSLDPSRTVTLSQLLASPRSPSSLAAPWVHIPRFSERLAWTSRFIDALPPLRRIPRWEGCPLIFFQASPPEEDRAEHERRLKVPYSRYAEVRKHLPPEVSYLHVETNWMPMLTDTDNGRIIAPLHPFSNMSGGQLFAPEARERVPNGLVLGYRLPDLPKLLEVSAAIATDSLARIVAHDIGHGVLPSVIEPEELHTVTMLFALNAPRFRHSDAWEQLVHDECTDPYFFLTAERRLKRLLRKFTPVRRLFTERLRETYVVGADERRERLWDIVPGMSLEAMQRQVLRVVKMMRLDGFYRYETRDPSYRKKSSAVLQTA